MHRHIVDGKVEQLIVDIECEAFILLDVPAAALPYQVIVAGGVPRLWTVDRAAFPADQLAAEQ